MSEDGFPKDGGHFTATVTFPSLSLPQVKLTGSHLTPVCYSFISYVQVSDWRVYQNNLQERASWRARAMSQ